MPFQPEVDQELIIDGVAYRIAEHPAAPGMPYGQEGRAAIVYQLLAFTPSGEVGGGVARALKVFKPRFRLPARVGLADKLAAFTGLDAGLDAVLKDGDRVGIFHSRTMWPFQYRFGAAMTPELAEAMRRREDGGIRHAYRSVQQ